MAVTNFACSSALPEPQTGQDLQVQSEIDDEATASRKALSEAKAALEQSESLLAEARLLAEETRKSETRCAEIVAKIPKTKQAVKKSGGTTPIITAPKDAVPAKTPAEKTGGEKAAEPLYSPSDAPRGAPPSH